MGEEKRERKQDEKKRKIYGRKLKEIIVREYTIK
jgi:hypothetical protein